MVEIINYEFYDQVVVMSAGQNSPNGNQTARFNKIAALIGNFDAREPVNLAKKTFLFISFMF